MTKVSTYVPPKLLIETSYKELLKLHNDYGILISWAREEKQIELVDLLRQNRTFIVGEPGQGKSRLLSELVGIAQHESFGTVLLKLNKLGRNQNLEDGITQAHDQLKFNINADEKMIVCLDGLDEVASNKFSELVMQIKDYIAKHPGHKIFITSRIHFFTKYEESLAQINASYALLMPFERNEQVTLLKQYGMTDLKIDEAFMKLKQPDKETVLQTPRYLEYFAQWFSEGGSSKQILSRSDIFNHFVNQSLNDEDRKNDKKIAAFRRRTLEKLALVMEIAQTNSVTHDEMITFIEDYRSEAKLLLINSADDLESIYNHGLLKDDGGKITFDNAELQEYLAASAINRMDNVGRAAFQLAVDKDQRSIHPSWYSTLSFLLEMRPELLANIINLEKPTPENPGRPQDPDTHKLISGVSADLIPVEIKDSIFTQVLSYYLENNIYLKPEVANRLAFYITPKTSLYLREAALELEAQRSYANLVSIAEMAGSLRYIDRLADETFWKEKLVAWALIDSDDEYLGVLKRYCMHALAYFGDEDVIEELKILHNHRDELVQRAYEGMCDSINPDHPKSLETFVEGIKNDSIEARLSLNKLRSAKSLTTILNAMIDDKEFLHQIVSHDSIFKSDNNKFLTNLLDAMDGKLLDMCKDVVLASFEVDHGYYVDRSHFIKKLISLVASQDSSYFSSLLNWSLESPDKPRIFNVQTHLASIMDAADIDFWSKLINKHESMKNHIFRIVTILDQDSSLNSHSQKIVKAARLIQPELFKDYDSAVLKASLRGKLDKDQEEFDRMMKLVRENDHIPALNKALKMFNDENSVTRYGKNIDKHLWSQSKRIILDQHDPADAVLKIHDKKADGSQPFTISNFIWNYNQIVRFALKTKQDISKYRKNFVALLAFTFNDETEMCINLLGNLSKEEAQLLLSTFNDLSSDRARFHPRNFIEAVKKFRLVDAVDVIDRIVDHPEFDIYVRKEALELSEMLSPNQARLIELFQKFSDENNEESLKRTANALLITKHGNSDAVKWLIDQIKLSAAEFIEKTGIHSVGPLEHEIHSGERSKPLKELSDGSYIDLYLKLLEFSFEIFSKGNAWHNYTYYIWSIVVGYFEQLKNNLRFDPLIRLEQWVADNSKLDGINYFKDKLVGLRRSYMLAISRPKNFNGAIKIAERIRDEDDVALTSVNELKLLLEKIIQEETTPWIETDARKIMNETHAQKLIKVQLESSLLKNGFNPTQLKVCNIFREAQELDDTRTDFLIYHGFTGPVIIELKMLSNSDLKGRDLTTKKSYSSLKNYMRQYKTDQAILMVLDDDEPISKPERYSVRMKKISDAYGKIDGVSVLSARLPDRKSKSAKKPGSRKRKK